MEWTFSGESNGRFVVPKKNQLMYFLLSPLLWNKEGGEGVKQFQLSQKIPNKNILFPYHNKTVTLGSVEDESTRVELWEDHDTRQEARKKK